MDQAMTDDNMFGVTALIESLRANPSNNDIMADYIAHVRRAMARTQAEIDKAMHEHPELRDLRF